LASGFTMTGRMVISTMPSAQKLSSTALNVAKSTPGRISAKNAIAPNAGLPMVD
jgi:hypothetical protein